MGKRGALGEPFAPFFGWQAVVDDLRGAPGDFLRAFQERDQWRRGLRIERDLTLTGMAAGGEGPHDLPRVGRVDVVVHDQYLGNHSPELGMLEDMGSNSAAECFARKAAAGL